MSASAFTRLFGEEAVKRTVKGIVGKTVELSDGTKATVRDVINIKGGTGNTISKRYKLEDKNGNFLKTVTEDEIKLSSGRSSQSAVNRQADIDKTKGSKPVPERQKTAQKIQGFKKMIDQGQVNTTDDVKRLFPGDENREFRNFVYKNYNKITENTINKGKPLKKSLSDSQKQKQLAQKQKLEDQKKAIYEQPVKKEQKIVQGVNKQQRAAQEASDRVEAARKRLQERSSNRAKGGVIRANQGAFLDIQNNFSSRMLPGKKRTTRIY